MCDKMAFEDKADAVQEATYRALKRRGAKVRTKKHGMNLYPYNCPYCDNWHLTTQKPRKKR